MAERQVLGDPINVGWPEESGLSQGAPALGILALKQVAFSGAVKQDFARGSYLEALGYGFPGFYAFGASHIISGSAAAGSATAAERGGGMTGS